MFVERGDDLDTSRQDEEVTACTCDAGELTCTLWQPGGTSELHFTRGSSGVVLREHHWEYP